MADTSAADGTRPEGTAPDDADRAAIEREVAAARGDRDALGALLAAYQTRISRRADDFAATHGLTLVQRELAGLSHGADPWDKSVRKLLR